MPDLADVAGQLECLLQKWERKESAGWASPFNEKAYNHARTLLTAAIYELADTIATGGKVTDATQSTAVAVVERPRATLMRPIAAPKDVLLAQEETRALIKEALKPDRDYGLIRGTQRETLFKAGAERIILAFGCFAQFRVVEKEIDHDRVNTYEKRGKEETSLGLYRYVVECQIVNRANGDVVGSFIGSCSSMESKYISRPRDSENTIVKMAEKRALVGAALTTYGLSDQFTQDLEEGGTAAAEEKAPVKTSFTLDEAAAFPFPFKRGTELHGKPLKDLATKHLESIRDWIREKQQEDETFHQDTLAAMNIVLGARSNDPRQAKLDLEQKQDKATADRARDEIATDSDLEEDRRPAHAGAVDESFPSALEESDDDLPF